MGDEDDEMEGGDGRRTIEEREIIFDVLFDFFLILKRSKPKIHVK
jgi:hypothetical protein